jgi:hypothetical protein
MGQQKVGRSGQWFADRRLRRLKPPDDGGGADAPALAAANRLAGVIEPDAAAALGLVVIPSAKTPTSPTSRFWNERCSPYR